jgi:phospholipase C
MRASRMAFLALVLTAVGAAASSTGRGGVPARLVADAAPVPAGVAARPFVKHVVVIVQENRSFDNFFGGPAPSAPSGAPSGSPPPSAYPNADSAWPPGVAAHMVSTPIDDNSANGGHDGWACLNQSLPYARFSTNQWIAASSSPPPANCTANGNYFRFVPQSQRTIYWQIARAYGLGDRFFAATNSASYPPHQFLVAGDASFTVPVERAAPAPDAANEVRRWWIADQPTVGPAEFPGCSDKGPASGPVVGPSVFTTTVSTNDNRMACYDRPTYADRLDAAGVSWTHYTTAMPAKDLGVFDGFINSVAWNGPTHVLHGGHFLPTTQVLRDARAGKLPEFAWVKPPCIKQSDHPGQGGHNGPNWVGSVINAIGGSSEWSSTVIFVIWDDWGGFYDHVVPPTPPPWQLGRGVRIPFLVISPYLTAPGAVVHTEGHPGSIMRFVDDLYAAQPLTSFDRDAPDLAGWFTFTASRSRTPFRVIPGAASQPWNDHMCDGSRAVVPIDS